MSSDRYEILRPFITPRVTELVRGRLFEGLKFFKQRTLIPAFTRSEVKLALLLVLGANPEETLTEMERRLIRDMQQSPAANAARQRKRKAL